MVYKSSVNANGGGGSGGNVTLVGENYLSLTGQQITANPINLAGSNVTSILGSVNGGTANGFTKFSGPASSEKTFTLPNTSDTIGCLGQAQTWSAANIFTSAANKILVNNSNANAQFAIEQSGTGDASLQFLDTGVRAWVIGQDTSDSHKFKISAANDGFASPLFSMTTAGVAAFTGALSASNLSNNNTGDQTIMLTGDATGSGTGSFATTVVAINGVAYNADPLVQYANLSPSTSSRNLIQTTSNSAVGLTVKSKSGSTVDTVEIQRSDGRLQFYIDKDGNAVIGDGDIFTSSGQTYTNSNRLYFTALGAGSYRNHYIQCTPNHPPDSEIKMSFVANGTTFFSIGDSSGLVTFASGVQIGSSGGVLAQGNSWRTNSASWTMRAEGNNIFLKGEKNTDGAYEINIVGSSSGGGSATASNICGFFNDATVVARVDPNGVFGGRIGTSATLAKHGGTIFDHFTDAGNATTTETDLYSDTIPANALNINSDKLDAEYGGVFVSSGTATRQIKIYFGGSVIFDTGALTLSLSAAWTAYVTLIRVSATVIRYMISFATEGAALSAYTSVGELTGLTLSNANILKITGQAAGIGAATNDIVAKMGTVKWLPAA